MRRGLAIAALVLALDQASKTLVLALFAHGPHGLVVLPVFNLVLVFNRGVSFSLLTSGAEAAPYLLSALALAVAAALVYWLRTAEAAVTRLAVGLVLGGAVGNVVDRLRFGAVVDFLDFHWKTLHWPAFNLADSAICLGAAILIWDALFGRSHSR